MIETIDHELASAVAATAIWCEMERDGLVPSHPMIDREKTFDLLSRCEEHAVEPEFSDVLEVMVQLARDCKPDLGYEEARTCVMASLREFRQ